MTWWHWALLALAFYAGGVAGVMLGANARADLEDEVASLQRRLLARYEEHA
jgi:hypothetical protein